MPPIDVARARAETPGCRDVVHFNNAGAALPTARTLRTQIDYLGREARIGGYEAQADAADQIENAYGSIAKLINAEPTDVALATSATAALDLFVYSLPWQTGDRLLTTQSEYGANYVAYLQIAARHGITVEVVPNNGAGELDVEALEGMVDERVKLISVNHVPTNGGLVNPAAEIGRVATAHGIPYLLDACQSAGQIPLDVDEIGCDALTSTGRKFLRGPRGTGFLWVRPALLETIEPIMIDHDAATWTGRDSYELEAGAKRFETWERNWAAMLGLGAAVDDALDWGLDAINARIVEVAHSLRERLTDEVSDAVVRDLGTTRCGIVTFSLGERDVSALQTQLRDQGINVSVVPPASALLDTLERDLPPLMRASVHIYNTHDEIDALISALDRPT
ncbi:MAG: aminotransferase class V-fold PLP-dependent enzyme [Acidimicrobiales bacterium]